MSIDEIEKHAAEHGLVTITAEEYDELVSRRGSTPVPGSPKQSGDDEFVLVQPASLEPTTPTKADASVTTITSAEPTDEELAKFAAQRGLRVVPEKEYESLKNTASVPGDTTEPSFTPEYIKEQATLLGFVALPESEYQSILSRSLTTPTKDTDTITLQPPPSGSSQLTATPNKSPKSVRSVSSTKNSFQETNGCSNGSLS